MSTVCLYGHPLAIQLPDWCEEEGNRKWFFFSVKIISAYLNMNVESFKKVFEKNLAEASRGTAFSSSITFLLMSSAS